MTTADIERMAREAGIDQWAIEDNCQECGIRMEDLARFAELVANAERERIAAEFDMGHSHACIRCLHAYTPAPDESEDCPACGCDGTSATPQDTR